MKILHTITGLGINSGGPTTCTYNLIKGLNREGMSADILTLHSSEKKLIANDSFIYSVPSPNNGKLVYSSDFRKFLTQNNNYLLYHINAIWQYPSHCTAKFARDTKKPYLITPHGMLYPQALKYSKWVKKFFFYLWFKKDLENATCLHVTSKQEMYFLREMGFKNPIALIPNPIVFSEKPVLGKENKQQIGFIGRFHLIKNIESLIEAFKRVNNNKYSLVIIGSGDSMYEKLLREKSSGFDNIFFRGFLDGKEKEDAFRDLSYLVLPSHSENFGMVVPEALMEGIPVIASKGTPWEELNTHNCGWWVDNDVDTLAETIEIALNTPEEKRQDMGRNGQKFVIENYSVEVVTKKMIRLYEWILNGSEKPEFVFYI